MAKPIIYHIDVNSAFLSWEAAKQQLENPGQPDIRNIPSAICGDPKHRHGIILAKSIPAKEFGITTGEPVSQALKKCPTLTLIAPTYGLYVENSHKLMAHLRRYCPVVDPFSIDEAFCDMTGTELLYPDPIAFAHTLKDEIRETYGFTVNIGISSNRLLAKMASDFEKPDKVHTLFPDEVPSKMWPLPVEDLLFIGKNTAKKLHELGIHSIGDLAAADPALLQNHLKKMGLTAWHYANGHSDDDFSHAAQNKGYSNSTTLAEDVTVPGQAKEILLSLTETVASRLRYDDMKAGVVSVTIRNTDFEDHSKQVSLYSNTNVTEELYNEVSVLFDKLWDGSPIRLLGVAASKAEEGSAYQYELFNQGKHEKLEKLDAAIDKVRARYGDDSIKRAALLNNTYRPRKK